MQTDQQNVENFSSYQKFTVALLASIQFTVVLDFMVLSPLGDILMKSMNISTGQFGSVVSAYAFSAGISGLLAAGFADRFDRKKLLIVFYIGFIAGTVFCGLANTYSTLFIARIVTGIFGGVIGSITMAIVTDLFNLQQRGRVMGFVQMAFAGSQILGIPVGLYLADKFNWHATFFMIVGLAFIILILIAVKLKPIAEHLKLQSDKNALAHLWHTVQKKNYRIGFLATAVLSIGGFMMMPFTSAFMVNNVGIAQTQLPTIFLLTGIASIMVMPLIGRLSDKIDKFWLFTMGSILAAIMILIYTNLTPVPLWEVATINIILFVGLMSRMVPAMTLNSAIAHPADRGAYMSVNSSLQQMAGGVASLFAGLVVKQETKNSPLLHFDLLGIIMVAIVAISIFLIYRVNQMIKQS